MEDQIIKAALESLKVIAKDNNITVFAQEGRVRIGLPDGKNLELSNEEVKYQATEHHLREVDFIKHS